eukprot:SAG25_NODE_1004_length_4345_cov_2.492463_10_plen_91_part_00
MRTVLCCAAQPRNNTGEEPFELTPQQVWACYARPPPVPGHPSPGGCLIEAPCLANDGHGASLRQPFGSGPSPDGSAALCVCVWVCVGGGG